MLLGVRVTAYAIINLAEHRRRETAGLGAVINPAPLDRLMDLPTGAEMSLRSRTTGTGLTADTNSRRPATAPLMLRPLYQSSRTSATGQAGEADLFDEAGKPFPEPPRFTGQDHQGGFVDGVPPGQRLLEFRNVVVPDPGRIGEDERHARRPLAHQPVVVVEERFRLGSGLRGIRGRIDQDPGYLRRQLGPLPARHDDTLIRHHDRPQLISADGSAEIRKDSRCDAVRRQLRAKHEGVDLQLRVPRDERPTSVDPDINCRKYPIPDDTPCRSGIVRSWCRCPDPQSGLGYLAPVLDIS